MTAPITRRVRLAVESLEVRAVPANNLTIEDIGFNDTVFVRVRQTGPTVTIETKAPSAHLSLQTIQDALADPTVTAVVVSTAVANGQGNNGNQAGNIIWDAGVAGDLDFTGFGAGKTLTFQTIQQGASVGDITLTGVAFDNGGTDDRISLVFDSSDPDGDVTFQGDGGGGPTVQFTSTTVQGLTVATGTGAFAYESGGTFSVTAEVSGAISVAAGPVTLDVPTPLTAGGPIAVTAGGAVGIGFASGLAAAGDLTVAATGAVTADTATLSGGRVSVSGTTVTLNDLLVTSADGLTLSGTTAVDVDFGTYEVLGDVSITGGTIDLNGVAIPNNVSGVGSATVTATGTLTLTDSFVVADGPQTVSAAALVLDNAYFGGDSLTISGPITLTGSDVQFLSNTTLSVSGAINGAADLYLAAGKTIALGAPVGATTPLTSFNLLRGTLDVGANTLNAGSIRVGDPLAGSGEAVLGSSGLLAGNVVVHELGNLAPGGVGTVGTMTVTGNVTLNGDLAIDFGPAGADKLVATGNVSIGASSMLGGGLGVGRLTGVATVIDAGGAVGGTFLNAPVGVPALVGTDAITVLTYTPDVIVGPYTPPGGAGPVATGVESDPGDATGFKATLSGGGTVFTGTDWTGRLFLVARDTTPASKLTIATTANASDDLVTFPAGVLVSGSLAAFAAPKASIGDQFRVSGWVGQATFRDLESTSGGAPLEFGGTPAQATRITARNLTGSVRTGSALSVLKVTGLLGSQVGSAFLDDSVVAAPNIGTVTAAGAAVNFDTPGRLNSLKVAGSYYGDVAADSVGTIAAGYRDGDVRAAKGVTAVATAGAFHGAVTADSIGTFSAGGGEAALDSAKGIAAITGTGANALTLSVKAASVGTVKVGGELSGSADFDPATLDWDVAGGIAKLTAGAVFGLDLKAKFIGPVSVPGNLAAGLSGSVGSATFTLTGDDGTAGKYGLKALSAQGNVTDSRFDIETGNVGAVAVGRFHRSQLWLGYTPAASGDFLAGVVPPGGGRLTSFKTTATPLAVDHPLRWAFRDSQIVAGAIGTVTLSGLQTANGRTAFGIKVRTPGAVVKVLNADVPATVLPRNTALAPDNTAPYTPLAGDFYFLDV